MEQTNYVSEQFGLEGKVAMVTGGNSGIGKGIAIGLAKAGADLFIFTHSSRGQEEMRQEVEALGRKIAFASGDLQEEQVAMAAVEKCVEAYGRIDILVNNAGTIYRAPLLEGDNEGWRSVMDLNLNAVYYLSKVAARHMKEQGGGKIINIASMLSFQGGMYVPSYTASKHGVAGLTKAFANELAEHNIQINAIAPGYIETNNTEPIRADEGRNKEILSRIPATRWGKAEDLAAAAVFLSSKASDYMAGHILCVDGGWMVR
ncbi:2-dehydro-3-deoxy-D-gluconate 5-dehydrogenase KduD [Anaerotalea alkaliphila]|uniref:2-dehydro-3-deoxy-D-gluconate 5-dehydrogenase KduD n=1 Tax=Anaerotalea alkaliphila TaxID=2662126 RepID=A0A7X5HUX4_9FIRM|nr:2-dehydro-3-deoxy-D-gluconate 5-dehydrogenase KduD [Anaerotalea alkaliphila]NDL67089.1 2-dehydro-3-deoxy-D-gluconate 5-dehydrogenase KduD [Anaerotalea alkaliphila]